jgi:hypothetical protein
MTVLNVMPQCLIFAIAAGANQSRVALKGMLRQPGENLIGALAWRKYRIEHGFDFVFVDNQSQALDEAHPSSLEGWKLQSICKSEASIAQDFERQMQAPGHFALIIGCLGAQSKELSSEAGKFAIVIAKGASLGCTAARARYPIPSLG